MCGIFGLLQNAPKQELGLRLAAMRDILLHRGPDGSGQAFETAGTERMLALGHVRLSIIAPDAPTAGQPLADASGRYLMSFNGEIYNYPELADELQGPGLRFDAASDSSVLLAAFAKWGADVLPLLRGMFAFAVWDRKERRLFLARDSTGKKPLWIRRIDDGLAFASEIQALTRAIGRPVALDKDVDPGAVADTLIYKYVPDNRCLVRGIHELPPGCWMAIDGSRPSPPIVPVRWHQPVRRKKLPRRRLEERDIDAFRAKFDDAVRIRLRSDVPLGVFLSGGLDSSSVLAMAARHQDRPMQTFCVAFDGEEESYSEAWAAEIVAKRFGTRHHVLGLTPERFAASLETATWHRGAPLGEIADVALFALSKMARREVKTVLSGEGADELLAGYPRYWGELWARRWQAIMPRAADALPAFAAGHLPYAARRAAILARAASERDFATRQAGWFGALSLRDLRVLAPDLVHSGAAGWDAGRPTRDAIIHAAMDFDKAVWLPGNILARGDRLTMAAGVEMRMPFMDTDLAGFSAGLPEAAFVTGRTGKTILRRAMARHLPPEICGRKKYGFRVPFHEWCRGALRPMLEERLLDRAAVSHAFVRRDVIERMLAEHMRRKRNHEKALWSLLGLEIHLRQLVEGVPPTSGNAIPRRLQEPAGTC